ncbi:acyltransferase [Fluviibacterium sp. DFM31]|uniref:Acyltransferase n=1 Tax=Meridianimarinicoccus marinus TaxID=3231483 RepID=A0ABV3L4Q6_9RHOB
MPLILSQADAAKRNDIPGLDGLRTLAAGIVVLSHMSNAGWLSLGGLSFAGWGKIGVFVFFFLSAFLLSRIQTGQGAGFWTPGGLTAYGLRRLARIVPLYLLYLTLALVTTWALQASGQRATAAFPFPLWWQEYLGHLTLRDGKSVTWSVPVELKYYLLLPVVTLGFDLLQRQGRVAIFGAGLAGFVALAVLSRDVAASNSVALWPYLSCFWAGSLAGVLSALAQARGVRPPRRVAGAGMIVGGIALVLTIPDLSDALFGDAVTATLRTWLVPLASLCAGLLVLGLEFGPRPLRRPFETPLMRAGGALSFGIYLWHMAVLDQIALRTDLTGGLAILALLAGTLALSLASYLTIEAPILRRSQRLAHRLTRPRP